MVDAGFVHVMYYNRTDRNHKLIVSKAARKLPELREYGEIE
ncbi:MAG: hypothetical protein QXF58_05875 [Desulfurococcaceae archaeon]